MSSIKQIYLFSKKSLLGTCKCKQDYHNCKVFYRFVEHTIIIVICILKSALLDQAEFYNQMLLELEHFDKKLSQNNRECAFFDWTPESFVNF